MSSFDNMSRRKKITLASLLVMAVGALIGDRMFFSVSGPESVQASSDLSFDLSVQPIAFTVETAMPAIPFPKGLEAWKPRGDIVNIFLPPFDRPGAEQNAFYTDASGNPIRFASTKTPRIDFAQHYVLQGVADLGELRVAIIDDQWLRVGESLNGCELTTIADTEVQFMCFDGQARLTLEDEDLVTRN